MSWKELAKVPLWKKKLPKYPLYHFGDPQRKVYLPMFWMKIIPPKEKIPKDHVHFIVHPEMNKPDIKQYLEKVYNVSVLHIRTEIREKEILGRCSHKNGLTPYMPVWKELQKYAYVQLKADTFEYPAPFTQDDASREGLQIRHKMEYKVDPYLGLPLWFKQ